MEISEAPSSIAGDHPPSTKKIEHCKTMSPRRFPPPWYVEGDAVAGPASTRQALAADAPRAFRPLFGSLIKPKNYQTAICSSYYVGVE